MQTIVINNTKRKLTPLLMKPELVSQTLKGVKNQTRRLNGLEEINQNPNKWNYDHQIIHGFVFETKPQSIEYDMIVIKSPYGKKGDIIWVREMISYSPRTTEIIYRGNVCSKWDLPNGCKWVPSIHMPKFACRLFLQIVDVKPQLLQDITDEDALAEGVKEYNETDGFINYLHTKGDGKVKYFHSPKDSFSSLWDLINAKKEMCWEWNPWVWRIEYKVIDKPDGWG